MLEFAPDCISLRRAGVNPARKKYAGVAELSDRRHRGAGSLKSIEQHANRSLNLLIGIEKQSPACIVSEANRRPPE